MDTHRCFVAGTALAGNETGVLNYKVFDSANIAPTVAPPVTVSVQPAETLAMLRAELDDALVNYSSKQLMWVERDLSAVPETDENRDNAKLITPTELAKSIRNCVIRAPAEFGLTCVGRKIAYEYHLHSDAKDVCLYIDASSGQVHRNAVETLVADRLEKLKAREKRVGAVVVDGWLRDTRRQKLLRILRELYGEIPIVLLERIDLGRDIERMFEPTPVVHGEMLYLWALTQSRIRELVEAYVKDIARLDPTIVTHKIIKDIDSLNIFRTPLNCLMFLRLAEDAFDDSPVNRTELIHRVLFLLFYHFDQIPTYASRPDLKDCEYVLGFLCEWLLREDRQSFSRHDFYAKGAAYCQEQFVSVDLEVLFAFLLASRIIVYHGNDFEFRFTYWLHYFAAHRMHHDDAFAQWILSEKRYTAIPGIIEFYTGIDRRRVDAVRVITKDLGDLAATVAERTGLPASFDPFAHAKWTPNKDDVKSLKAEIENSIASSSLPAAVKDAIADKHYNRARPYSQEMARFVETTSMLQMFQAIRGAARALRNSDHVPPADKLALLDSVMTCWNRAAQVLALISPVLAEFRHAACEGISFVLGGDFDTISDQGKRWLVIMNAIPYNVVTWFEDDLYSRKLGPLVYRYLHDQRGNLSEVMLFMMIVHQRPDGWAKEVKQYIRETSKDSLGLLQVFRQLRSERKIGFVSDLEREQINNLSALAKHEDGADEPNRDQVRRAAKKLGDPLPPSSSDLRHSEGPRRSREKK